MFLSEKEMGVRNNFLDNAYKQEPCYKYTFLILGMFVLYLFLCFVGGRGGERANISLGFQSRILSSTCSFPGKYSCFFCYVAHTTAEDHSSMMFWCLV